MTQQEQDFFNYIETKNANETAAAYDRVIFFDPAASPEELAFRNYLQGLQPEEAFEARYAVYSAKYDVTPEEEHSAFEDSFEQLGYSLAICKKRKSPEN